MNTVNTDTDTNIKTKEEDLVQEEVSKNVIITKDADNKLSGNEKYRSKGTSSPLNSPGKY